MEILFLFCVRRSAQKFAQDFQHFLIALVRSSCCRYGFCDVHMGARCISGVLNVAYADSISDLNTRSISIVDCH